MPTQRSRARRNVRSLPLCTPLLCYVTIAPVREGDELLDTYSMLYHYNLYDMITNMAR